MKKDPDPLRFCRLIPSPELIRADIKATLTKAERLKLLLEVAEKAQVALTTSDQATSQVGATR